MKDHENPFLQYDPQLQRHTGAVDAAGRCGMVDKFSRQQCELALQVPGLQKAVQTRLRSRIRQLEKQEVAREL